MALGTLRQQAMTAGRGWILDVDIHRRVRDGVLQKLIHKWLQAGVVENGNVSYPDAESPQGGVVSPMLSNVFLHYMLDVWFEEEVKPRLAGQLF